MSGLASTLLFLLYLNAPAVAVRIHGAPYVLAAVVPLALAIPVAHKVFVRGEPLRFPIPLVVASLMLGLHALSALASDRPGESLESLQTWMLEGVLLALLVANAIRTRSEILAAIRAIVVAGAVMGAIALLQQLLGPADHSFWGFGQLDSEIIDEAGRSQLRLAGPIGETNRFAQIMAVLIPMAAGCALTSRGLARFGYGLATALIAGGMVLAFSRGAIVALAIAVPFALAIRFLKPRVLLVGLGIGISVLLTLPHYAERVASIGDVAIQSIGGSGLRNADGAARGRVTEMQATGLLFMDHPILGAGPGLAPHYYEQYAGVVGGKVRAGGRRSHNLYLQLAAETGVVGLAAFVWMLVLVFRELERARARLEFADRRLWAVVCGLELALVISLATSLFLHAAYIRYFWLLIGLSSAAAVQQQTPALVRLLSRVLRETAERIRADA